jgi:hypothetical protein
VSAVCIVFIGVSFDAMLKSGTLVGVCLISRWIFQQRYYRWQYIGISGVLLSFVLVGLSGVLNAEASVTITTSRLWVAVIISLKFLSQVLYSVKICYEEYFVQKKGYHPIMICGIEGFWSFLLCGICCQLIAHHMPGREGNGVHEDFFDTVAMMRNAPILVGLAGLYFCLEITYNCVSTTLIGRTSAVVRTLMEALRTFLIWFSQLALFYGLGRVEDPSIHYYKIAGEQWCHGSWVQLAGFVLTTVCVLMYQGIPEYPCFNYAVAIMNSDDDNDHHQHRLAASRGTKDEEKDNVQILSEAGASSDDGSSSAMDGLDADGNRNSEGPTA